jgi:CDP-diacylglycerol--glycerol-3-phosphate 3-phosphatidyltransferase
VSSRAVADVPGRGAVVTALPNLLSLLRIGLVPVLVVLLACEAPAPRLAAAFLFLIACVTDFLDGWLARRHGLTSTLGQFLDPLADKIMVAAVLIMLSATGPEPRVPAWMAVVIVVRELAVTGLRGIASRGGLALPAQELGKYKMIFQMFALQGLLLQSTYPLPGTPLRIDFYAGGMVFLWIAVGLSLWSAVDYHVRIFQRVALD